jgi:NAD(P)-dependent dehydrogenase (short-subunit alcohol dehydrogenase family)
MMERQSSRICLADKTVIVTGAAGGIGRSVAKAFAQEGAKLLLADIQDEKAHDVAVELNREGGGQCIACAVDVVSSASLAAMVKTAITQLGAVDVLVHCAGLDAPRANVWELNDELWDRIIDIDLSSAWRCAKAVIGHMADRRSGRIIYIGSIAGRRPSFTTAVAYNAAKAGLQGLTVGLAKQLEPHGILVNTIAPGPTGTGEPMTEAELEADRSNFPIPIQGAQPVADACLFLAGSGGSWISGTVLNVSGGRWHG